MPNAMDSGHVFTIQQKAENSKTLQWGDFVAKLYSNKANPLL